MKTKRSIRRKTAKTPVFVLRAERAMRRAAKNVHAQSRALNLPIIVWQDGKVMRSPPENAKPQDVQMLDEKLCKVGPLLSRRSPKVDDLFLPAFVDTEFTARGQSRLTVSSSTTLAQSHGPG